MISGHQLSAWFPLVVVMLPAIGAIVRYSVLLAGLIVTLRKSVKADRPEIFREFARAMAIPRPRQDRNRREPRERRPDPWRLAESAGTSPAAGPRRPGLR